MFHDTIFVNDDQSYNSHELNGLYIGLSFLSLFGSFLVFLFYRFFKFSDNKDVTNKIVSNIGFFDTCFSLGMLLPSLYGIQRTFDNDDICAVQSIWLQFFGLATVSWNMFFCVNLLIMLRDPMSQTQSYKRLYYLYTFVMGAISCTAIGVKHKYGPSGNGTCWVKGTQNPYRFFFLFPLLIAFAIAIVALISSIRRINQLSYEEKSANSQALRRRMVAYVVAFILCWIGPLTHRIVEAFYNNSFLPLIYLDSIGMSVQGFVSSIVWLSSPEFVSAVRFSCAKRMAMTTDSEPFLKKKIKVAKINEVLRREWIWCLLCGIQQAAEDLTNKDNEYRFNSQSNSKKNIQSAEPTYLYDDLWRRKLYKRNEEQVVLKNLPKYLFVEYAPDVFRGIRHAFGITPDQYLTSMSPATIHKLQERITQGRSGSFFFFSSDKKFLIKTIPENEKSLLVEILPQYKKYLESNPDTLMTKYYGCYALQMPTEKITYVVVMANSFNTTNKIHEKYDIKGSWVKRYVGGRRDGDSISGKDMDLKKQLYLGEERKQKLLGQIEKDTEFLCDLGIIDYSLLLGIHNSSKRAYTLSKSKKPTMNMHDSMDSIGKEMITSIPPTIDLPFFQEDEGGMLSDKKTEIYYFSVIDTLTKYDGDKILERFLKVYILGNDKYGVSVLAPREYRKRFLGFLSKAMQ